MFIKKLSLNDSYEKLKSQSRFPKVKTGFELFDNFTGGIGGGESYVINGENISDNIKFMMSLLISMAENNTNKKFLYIGNKISPEILMNAYLAHQNNIPDYKFFMDRSIEKDLLFKSMDVRNICGDIQNIYYVYSSDLNSEYVSTILETIDRENINYVFIEDGSNINFKNEEDPIYELLSSSLYHKSTSFIISNLDLSLSKYKNYDGIFDLIQSDFVIDDYLLKVKMLNNIYEPLQGLCFNTYNGWFKFDRSTYTLFKKGENKNE